MFGTVFEEEKKYARRREGVFILLAGIFLGTLAMLNILGISRLEHHDRTYFQIRQWTSMATLASMIAYLSAQLVDVQVFHLLKKWTRGRALWLRNNGSTLTSQLVDSIAVIVLSYYFTNAIGIAPGETVIHGIMVLILSNYLFKMTAALIDTIPFYIGTRFLTGYLRIDPKEGYRSRPSE